MSKKIHEYIDRRPGAGVVSNTLLQLPGRVGIEFEWERCRNVEVPGWNVTRDGSLRNNGLEYVLAGAVGGAALVRRLMALSHLMKEGNARREASWRTSVHVHVDVRDLDGEQLRRLLAASIIFEDALFGLSGNRACNNYCLAERDVESASSEVVMGEGNDVIRSIHGQGSKYRALNTLPIWAQGSLEYRHHEGIYEPMDVLPWVRVLLSLKNWAVNNEDTTDALFARVSGDYPGLVNELFGESADKVLKMPMLQERVLDNIRRLQTYCAVSEGYHFSPDSALASAMEGKFEERKRPRTRRVAEEMPRPAGIRREVRANRDQDLAEQIERVDRMMADWIIDNPD